MLEILKDWQDPSATGRDGPYMNGKLKYGRILIRKELNKMIIELKQISIKELTTGYQDNNENGIMDIWKARYSSSLSKKIHLQGQAKSCVIDSITKDYPLNVMYWAVREDGNFEVIDGQQRTISICQFIEGDFAFNDRYFHNLQANEKEQLLNYKLMVYFCSGTDSEKLEWFKTINIAGEQLTDQELRNAVYSGSWVSDAKRYFSKTGCPAYGIGSDYLNGTAIRQDYLETALKWISNDNIEMYMAKINMKLIQMNYGSIFNL